MIPRRAREPHGVGRRSPPVSHKFCAPSNWTRARTTDPFLGRLVRQGLAVLEPTYALILMGDWCGSSIRHFSTETPELPNHRADRTSAAKGWATLGVDGASCPNDVRTAWD